MKLKWDEDGKRLYETGVEKTVLYPYTSGSYPKGVAWDGVSAITERPSGAESTPVWADNTKYLNLISAEDFAATIEAFTFPEEFHACDGSKELAPGLYAGQQNRQSFGLSYITKIGNDTEGQDHGYKIHLVYGATASPSERGYKTVNDNPEAMPFSWELTTVPQQINSVEGCRPTAHLVVDSTKVSPEKLTAFLDIIHGKDGQTPGDARLPLPDEVVTLITSKG